MVRLPSCPKIISTVRDVRRGGQALATDLIWTDETAETIGQVFSIANTWRDSHAYPMRKIRNEPSRQIRTLEQNRWSFHGGAPEAYAIDPQKT